MIKIAIKFSVWINNFSYKLISFLAVKENGGIHPKHRILDYHRFFLDNIAPGDTILDIGCGNGSVALDVAKKSGKVVAIDLSARNIEQAKKSASLSNIQYLLGDATKHEFAERFDAIILSNVLEHIEDREAFLDKIKHLAPKILVRVPLLSRDWLAVYKKEQGLEYRLDKTHSTEYTEESFRKEMEKSGLEIKDHRISFGELYAVISTSHE